MIRTAALVAIATITLVAALPAQHDHERSIQQIGLVAFPTSCKPRAQGEFERAMALLHSFWWEQAQTAFQRVVAADSTCAMGY